MDISKVGAEIQYECAEGLTHSDLSPNDRETLHAALDEWLNKSGGTGFFYVGNWEDLRDEWKNHK